MADLHKGDKVSWHTPQGKTDGTVTKKVTGSASAGGHTAKADPKHPQYEVKSSASGKTAIHKPDSLDKK